MPQYAKIDVTKIDKSRLFKGQKGTYLDLVIIETPNSKYGTHIIKQSAPKGTDMPILGNISRPQERQISGQEAADKLRESSAAASEDVPF